MHTFYSVFVCNTQVYSQLSFKCPENKYVEFKQELKDETGTSLLDDVERIDCRSVLLSVRISEYIIFCGFEAY